VKKLLIFLLVWVLAVAGGIVGVKIYRQNMADQYSATAIPYVQKVVAELSSWDLEVIRGLMSEGALKSIEEEKLARIIRLFSKMGQLQSMEDPVYAQTDVIDIGKGEQTLVRYTVKAHYQNGDALVTLSLLDREGQFSISYFNLTSETLAK